MKSILKIAVQLLEEYAEISSNKGCEYLSEEVKHLITPEIKKDFNSWLDPDLDDNANVMQESCLIDFIVKKLKENDKEK